MVLRVTQQNIEVLGKTDVLAPVTAGSIPELVEILLHNWSSTVNVQSTWSTDVTIANSLAEDRRGLVDRPYRTVSVRWSGLSQAESARILQAAMRASQQRTIIPLVPDTIRLTAAASIGATTLACVVGRRRFFPGARVVIHDWDNNRRPANIEFGVIASVGDSSITLIAPTILAHGARARVIPILEVELVIESSGTLLSRHVHDRTLEFQEITGPSALPAWSDGWNDPPCNTYRGMPIFCLQVDWSVPPELTIRRAGDRERQGRGTVTDPRGDRPRLGFEFSLTGLDRDSAYEIIRFFDSRKGRLRAFWLVNPEWLWDFSAIAETEVTVVPAGQADDVRRFFEFVGLVYRDGTTIIRGLTDLIEDVDGWHFVFSEPIPSDRAVLGGLRSVTSAHIVRLESDTMNEEWTTDRLLTTRIPLIELGRNETTRIARFDEVIPDTAPDAISNLFLWLESPDEMRKTGGGLVALDGDEVATWKDKRLGVTREVRTDVPPQERRHEYYTGATQVLRFSNFSITGKGELVLNDETPIYSNVRGTTVLIAAQLKTVVHSTLDDFLLNLPNAIEWTPTACRLYEDFGAVSDNHLISTHDVFAPYSVPHVVALTWKPGQFARIYQDGRLRGEMPVPVVDLPRLTGEDAKPHFMRFANPDMDTASDDDGWLDSILIFDRCLTIDELNAMGKYLSTLVGTTWRKVT